MLGYLVFQRPFFRPRDIDCIDYILILDDRRSHTHRKV
ncbi:hypothetical protein NSP_20510 [Nodularia spumigena CCY9414]|nr:hypothetical protein NSP_20510 [Nodularia spumigena CCY9414]